MKKLYLEYVIAIAEEKSFTSAAKRLFITQPSLSQSIQKLEKDLGVELFDRKTKPLCLTEAGEKYIRAGLQILDFEQQLYNELADFTNSKNMKLYVGTSTYRSSCIIPSVIYEFQQKMPNVEIILAEYVNSTLEEMVWTGELDIAVTVLADESKDRFLHKSILDEALMLHVPSVKNANTRADKPIDIGFANMKAYKDVPFIALSPQQRMHKLLIKICNDNGFQPNIIFETKSVETAFSMVLNGVGVTILPDTLLRFGNFAHHPKFFRIDHSLATRQIGVIYKRRRYLSRAASLFIELLENWGRLARQKTYLETARSSEISHP